VKNKVAAPFKAAEFDILFDEGISRTGELIDLGLETGLLQKSGTWLSYGPERLGQGRESARQTLKANPPMADRLEQEIRVASGLSQFAGNAANQANPASEPKAGGKIEPSGKIDAGKTEPPKAESLKVDSPKTDPAKGDGRPGSKGPVESRPEAAVRETPASALRNRRPGAR
jgi:hypothetical protein